MKRHISDAMLVAVIFGLTGSNPAQAVLLRPVIQPVFNFSLSAVQAGEIVQGDEASSVIQGRF